jgi:hypothetical protein
VGWVTVFLTGWTVGRKIKKAFFFQAAPCQEDDGIKSSEMNPDLNMSSSFKRFIVGVALLGAFAKLRKATISFVISVCPSAWNSSAPVGPIVIKSDTRGFFFRKSVEKKFQFH